MRDDRRQWGTDPTPRYADDLDRARERLDSLEKLLAYTQTRVAYVAGRIARPRGLLTFAEADILDQDGCGLRPWLKDLMSAAGFAGWAAGRRAGRDADIIQGLAAWHDLATRTEQVVREVAASAERLLHELDEQRGLLEAARARADKADLAEDEELSALHAEAAGLLSRAPTDLAEAQRLVLAYLDGVEARRSKKPSGTGQSGGQSTT